MEHTKHVKHEKQNDDANPTNSSLHNKWNFKVMKKPFKSKQIVIS